MYSGLVTALVSEKVLSSDNSCGLLLQMVVLVCILKVWSILRSHAIRLLFSLMVRLYRVDGGSIDRDAYGADPTSSR